MVARGKQLRVLLRLRDASTLLAQFVRVRVALGRLVNFRRAEHIRVGVAARALRLGSRVRTVAGACGRFLRLGHLSHGLRGVVVGAVIARRKCGR